MTSALKTIFAVALGVSLAGVQGLPMEVDFDWEDMRFASVDPAMALMPMTSVLAAVASSLPSATSLPTDILQLIPTVLPTALPTELPSGFPSALPTGFPSELPSGFPPALPTELPTELPSGFPTSLPTALPSELPSGIPTVLPTALPTALTVTVTSTLTVVETVATVTSTTTVDAAFALTTTTTATATTTTPTTSTTTTTTTEASPTGYPVLVESRDGRCSVTVNATFSYDASFGLSLRVNNTSSDSIDGWQLRLGFIAPNAQDIAMDSFWSAQLQSPREPEAVASGDAVMLDWTFGPETWNTKLSPETAAHFGIIFRYGRPRGLTETAPLPALLTLTC